MRRAHPTWIALISFGLLGGLLGGSEVVVRSTRPLGPYLEVRLGGDEDLAVLLPATETCARLARPEGSVRWVARGMPGRLEDGDAVCEAAGILDLTRWRDRRPRPTGALVPSKTARWTLLHRDGRRALLRGRFELAGLVGMPAGYDLVAVIADDASCAGVLDATEGTLEFRPSGRVAFRLIAGGSRCEVLGFARPPPGEPAP
jgi:hypothetical protein